METNIDTIQKEEISNRRKELAEHIHADSVFRDIVAHENERENYEKRWFWELLQNAKDSVGENEKVNIKIEITENQISFSHTGNPFDLDDILSLIIQGSSKTGKDGKTGRFGTGFITTYLLSREVRISGKLSCNKWYFDFLLDRNADNNNEFYAKQDKSNNMFENSIRTESYLGDTNYQTRFIYNLNTEGNKTADAGLVCQDELIPITQLFNQQIENIIIINGSNEYRYEQKYICENNIHGKNIKEWSLCSYINNNLKKIFKAYVLNDPDYEICLLTIVEENEERIFNLSDKYPRLFFTFPLIGTEDIGIPFIINSTKFKPKIERDGIYLNKNNINEDIILNKKLIHDALIHSSFAFSGLVVKNNIKGVYELFNYLPSKSYNWLDIEWMNKIKIEILDLLLLKPLINANGKNEKVSIDDIALPYTGDDLQNEKLWDLLSNLIDVNIPLKEENEKWISIIKQYSLLLNQDIKIRKCVFDIEKLIKHIEAKSNLENLKKALNSEAILWLNNFYALIIKLIDNFPLDKKVILNEQNQLKAGDGMFWDECRDKELNDISELIGIDFSNMLISNDVIKFHIAGISDYSKDNAIKEILLKLNSQQIASFDKSEIRKACALFLKWLIEQNLKDVIRDFKVLTGKNEIGENKINFETFPKSEHRLLPPIDYFKTEYPLYSELIREKDFMHNIYNKYLGKENYEYLFNNGFISISPLIIKNDVVDNRNIELLIVKEEDLYKLRDSDGKLKYKIKLNYSDFAFLTASEGHIYERNASQKSSLARFKFLLNEAVEKDILFDNDYQEIRIEGLVGTIAFHKCLWIYRAKSLQWVNIKADEESKYLKEKPSSKNLSELIKGDELLIKSIKGTKQQTLLNKLGIGVSDLIGHTLPSEKLKEDWDKAITNMITSDADPELVQEIFNDPNIQQMYEKKKSERILIQRNQKIGKLIEELFSQFILSLKEKGHSINIKREPFGSDYLLSDESSDLINENNQREGFIINNWFVELKATGRNYAAMTPLQAQTSVEKKDCYALIVVPLNGLELDLNYVRQNAKVISSIGSKIKNVLTDFNDVETKKTLLSSGKDGISVNIQDHNIRFNISSSVWNNNDHETLEEFIMNKFQAF